MNFNIKYLILLFWIFSFALKGYSQISVEEEIIEIKTELDSIEQITNNLKSKLEQLKLEKIIIDLNEIGHPSCQEEIEIVTHKAMVIGYNEKHEQAQWVSHIILPDIEKGNVSRTNDFRKDKLVSTGTAEKDDYWYSGYDRGHLAPSADFRWSKEALSESYYYSNMAPQLPELNREIWASLENTIRAYVISNKKQVYVITGGILNDSLPKMNNEGHKNEVSIPAYFYKVILDNSDGNQKAIGFVLPNNKCNYPIMSYAISVDSVEKITGINFYPNIKNEKDIESRFNIADWQVGKNQGNVTPINPTQLEKGTINTVQAKYNIGTKSTVCGTVVSTKYSEKSGATFLNLDNKFPDQIFSVTIWKDNRVNFSYLPEVELSDKKVCITGKIEDKKGTPTINVTSEKAIKIITNEIK